MDLTSNQMPFSFPLLKNQEILQCLSEAGIELTQTELMEPNRHKDRVKSVFAHLVQLGLGLHEKDFSTTSAAVTEKSKNLPYPELHEESFSDLKFLKACMKLMKICGLQDDFGMKDLHAPTSKRFRRQLSGAINFIKFREDRLQVYAELQEQRDELLSGVMEVNDENEMLSAQLEQAKIETENRRRKVEEVENDCFELETEISQQNKLQASIRQESTDLKKKANELKDKIATAALALQEVEAEERKLLPQVVKDPDRIKNEILELTKSLDAAKVDCENAEQEANISKLRIVNATKAHNDILSVNELAEEVKYERKKLEDASKETKNLESSIALNEAKTVELSELHETHERELHLIEGRTKNNRDQAKTKMESIQRSLEAANKELLILEKGRREGLECVNENEAQVRALKALIEEENEHAHAEFAEIMNAFKNLESAVLRKDEELMTAISAT